MSTDIDIRPAQASDLAVAVEWLTSEGLPSNDLTADHMDAPKAIRNTAEFSTLCPGDAVPMCKRL